nr:hypothetical protein [Nodosilinea sp. P-1105]
MVVWSLLITGDEPMMSKVKPGITPTERRKLVDAGLIRVEKRGRASHIVLEDKAWDWLAMRLQSPDFGVQFPSRATTAIPTFQVLLEKLGAFLRSRQISLADFLTTASQSNLDRSQKNEAANHDLIECIRDTYLQITSGKRNVRVKLAALRHSLVNFSQKEVDQALETMELAGNLVLMHLDDPEEITPEDDKAAVIAVLERIRYTSTEKRFGTHRPGQLACTLSK